MHISESLSGIRPGYCVNISVGSEDPWYGDFSQFYSGLTETETKYLVSALRKMDARTRYSFRSWLEANPRPDSMDAGETLRPYETDIDFAYRLFGLQPNSFTYGDTICVLFFEETPDNLIEEFE